MKVQIEKEFLLDYGHRFFVFVREYRHKIIPETTFAKVTGTHRQRIRNRCNPNNPNRLSVDAHSKSIQ